MLNIIGLGRTGCNIAERFSEYPQYVIYKIDEDIKKEKGRKTFCVQHQDSPEDYEANVPNMASFFKEIGVGQDVLFVVNGAGKISGASLRILQHVNHANVSVLYIRTDTSLSGERGYLQDRLVFGVFQEYARSGLFKCLYVVGNQQMEMIIGEDNIPVEEQHSVLNNLLVSTIHQINVSEHTTPIQGTKTTPHLTSRIATFGMLDVEKADEQLFYPIENIREIFYYYVFSKKSLTSLSVLNKVKDTMRERQNDGGYKVSYLIHSTEGDYNIGYCIAYARNPQIV